MVMAASLNTLKTQTYHNYVGSSRRMYVNLDGSQAGVSMPDSSDSSPVGGGRTVCSTGRCCSRSSGGDPVQVLYARTVHFRIAPATLTFNEYRGVKYARARSVRMPLYTRNPQRPLPIVLPIPSWKSKADCLHQHWSVKISVY